MPVATAPHTTPASRNLGLSEDALKSPKVNKHLFLNNPLVGNHSSVSVNEHAPPHTPTAGIRAQIGHLLPRHANFRARVQIHQIQSVPLVSGEFGVRWKFKSVEKAAPGPKQGLLDRVKAKARIHHHHHEKGKGREEDGEAFAGSERFQEVLSPKAPSDHGHVTSPNAPTIVARHKAGGGRSTSGTSTDHSSSMSSIKHDTSVDSSVSSYSSLAGHSQHLSVDWANSSSSTNPSTISSTVFNSSSANASHVTMVPTPDSHISDLSPSLLAVSSTPARGMTPFIKLKEHSVTWNQTLDTVLKFDIDRENSQVFPNPLKLVVMQRVIPDDPSGSPQNPRLGALYLNLSEYIGQGSVTRKYLLKESKTNATLKLTIDVEYVSGETHYIPPPLAKGEILNGIAGFLESDLVRKRPRALDLYGPYQNQEELEIDLLGAARSARPKTAKSARIPSEGISTAESSSEDERPSLEEMTEDVDVAFDVQRLPLAYGTKTTETLIEALFNPVKIAEKRNESPFTVYEPALTARPKLDANGGIGLGMRGVAVDRNATIGRRQGSMASSSVYSTSSSSASMHTTTTSESAGSKGQSREGGGGGRAEAYQGIVMARSTPEGRVVVDPHAHAHDEPAAAAAAGGVRGWWKRHTHASRPGTPTRHVA
ncbi:hypothetical protein B0H34DRAFT_800193 [Crassisporium funariophilum]|nr:hypothetical protein B0H34DRAFT_800193 [Crassisporium funariophilum]